MTHYAAEHASRETRDDAITATISLLDHDGQWGARRAQWVYFLVRLLPASPDRLPDALPCLLRLAEGRFSEPGDMTQLLSNHPFSGIRINLGSGSNLRMRAVAGLGALWDTVPVAVREQVRELLLSALGDRDPAVREGALIGIGEAARNTHENWQQRALVQALKDPKKSIRDRALKELT
jgi:hypothetical protein